MYLFVILFKDVMKSNNFLKTLITSDEKCSERSPTIRMFEKDKGKAAQLT